jgi:hypothetical protein
MSIIYHAYYLQPTLSNYLNNTKTLLHVDQHNKMFIAYILHLDINYLITNYYLTYYLAYLIN